MDLIANNYYDFFVRSKCGNGLNSNWVGPVRTRTLLSVDDNALSNFEYYPNPVDNKLLVTAPTTIDAITIFDAFGKKILSKNIDSLSSEIDFSAISTGLYFMEVTIGESSNTFKVIRK